MSSVWLTRRLPLAALVLAALVGALLWGQALFPGETAAVDGGPEVIATIPLGSSDEVSLTDRVAVDPERNRIYVVSNKSDAEKVFIIDGSTNTVTDTIVAGERIWGIGVNPTTNRIYLSTSLQVIDGETKTVLDHIEGVWGHVAVDPVANRIFTHRTGGHNDFLAIIDGANHEVSTVLVGSSPYIESFIPEVNPQTGLVYVSYGGDDKVTVVDPVAKTVVTNIDIGAGPGRPFINPQTNRIYLQNRVADETVVVDGSTHSVVARIPGEADTIAVNPATNRVYRAKGTDIEVIDGTTNGVVSTFRWSDSGRAVRMAVNPQTSRLYIVAEVGPIPRDRVVAVVQDVGAAPAPGPTVSPTPLPPAQGIMHNCPQPGRWAIAVWEGADGTDTGQALANCGEGAVAAAYRIDPDTQAWSRYFRGRPEISNLGTLGDGQGVLALGDGVSASSASGEELLRAAANEMLGCPQPGKWAISVWDGADGTSTEQAVATCGEGAVAAAYYIDPQTQVWSRWFAGRSEISNLNSLNNHQGVLALGTAPTPTPTPTPTPGTAGDVILVSSNAFTTTTSILVDGESRQLHVVGELRNESSTARSAGAISITVYDATGNVIGSRGEVPFDYTIRPGRTTAFHEWWPSWIYSSSETNDYPEGWTRYEITLSPRDPREWWDKPVDIAVENVQVTDGGRHVTGNVVNVSSKTVDRFGVDVYVIYYQADGTILNTRRDPSVNDEALGPGQSAPFDISFPSGEPVDFSTYVVQAYAEVSE